MNGIRPSSTAAALGLEVGDVIVEINGTAIDGITTYARTVRRWREDQDIAMLVSRKGSLIARKAQVVPFPKEQIEGAEIEYGSLRTEKGYALSTITARPKGETGKLPTILFVQWLSCSSVEMPFDDDLVGWRNVLHGFVRSGFALVRVDKAGVGDSQGPDCSQNDFLTEVAGHKAALKEIQKLEFVDPNGLFIFGGSMGGAIAPLIAENENLAGIIVSGTHVKTWYEHMLEFERNRLKFSGRTEAEINQAMQKFIEFYTFYLVKKRTPEDIVRDNPHLSGVWTGPLLTQFGRPLSYFQQVNETNFAAAWEKVSVPVLVFYGEHDWVMSRADHELIAEIVNSRHPGQASAVIHPKADHHFLSYDTPQMAFDEAGGEWDPKILQEMIDWLRLQLNK